MARLLCLDAGPGGARPACEDNGCMIPLPRGCVLVALDDPLARLLVGPGVRPDCICRRGDKLFMFLGEAKNAQSLAAGGEDFTHLLVRIAEKIGAAASRLQGEIGAAGTVAAVSLPFADMPLALAFRAARLLRRGILDKLPRDTGRRAQVLFFDCSGAQWEPSR